MRYKSERKPVILLLLLFLFIGILLFWLWEKNRNTVIGPIGKLLLEETENQPKSREEAQKRVKFTIFRPSYKPQEFNKNGNLVLFGNDKYIRINYTTNKLDSSVTENNIQINETIADEEALNNPEAILQKEDENIIGIHQVDICGLRGYLGLAHVNQQKLVFVKDKTRILYTVFPTPLSEAKIIKMACSMQSILIPN